MESSIFYIIIGVVALVIGIVTGKMIFAKDTKKQVEEAEQQSKIILREAELRAGTLKKEKELEVKEQFVQIKATHERDVMQRNQKILESENRLKQKEQSINQKEVNLDKQVKDNETIK